MKPNEIIICPECQKKLRLPSNRGLLNVKCPDCLTHFLWESNRGIIADKKLKKKNPLSKIFPLLLVLLIAILLIIHFNQNSPTSLTTHPQKPKWVTVSYSNLINPHEIIRTGQSLQLALGDPNLRNAVQPFVDSYSFLLQHVIEMTFGPDRIPHSTIIDAYPIGSAQPAWVSILRGGRIHITTDYMDHVRVFILGDDPKISYQNYYSVIRHCLNALLSPSGSSLNVEVFAYKNNYSNSELHLNLNPYVVNASSFPSESVPLDLSGLAAFFAKGPEIQGAQLDRSNGLILYGKQSSKQTLAGASISLSDFAVAYRAVFHAGDNEAFVSLDPHLDPTKVTVNFGGFLEDTRIGSVVLEADKRFKSITSGLDPNTFSDLRNYTRQHVDGFLSVNELELIDSSSISHGKWIGTRFWFYPDSIGIESDLNYKYSMITNPVFMADAERSREDFKSPEEFQIKKKATLSPTIRRNIDQLNQNYTQYAKAFSELKDLTTVARLMAICSWLRKANPRGIDLDSLLSVELPPFTTPREKTQLVAACFISYNIPENVTTDFIIKNSKVVYLSPVLDKKVSDHFLNSTNFAKYLCLINGMKEENYKTYKSEASQLFNTYQNLKVKDIIKTKKELKALASYSANSLDFQMPVVEKALKRKIKSDEKSLEELKSRIEQTEQLINSAAYTNTYNSLVDQHNEFISQYETIRARYNQDVNKYNSLDIHNLFVIEVGGGINLEPRNFKIKTRQNSVRLQAFQKTTEKAGTRWTTVNGFGKWIKSENKAAIAEIKMKIPRIEWAQEKQATSGNLVYKHIQGYPAHQYWLEIESPHGSWRDCRKMDSASYKERAFDGESKKIQVAEFHSGKLKECIIGQMDSTGRIVFKRSERKDILKPQEPPVWFHSN